MYPTVIVKGLSGLLVVLLVFSEVHSFIFEDEGGDEFCSGADNIHQNESSRRWLKSSCNAGQKIEFRDRMISVQYNGIPRGVFRQTTMLVTKPKQVQNRQDINSRKSSSRDQVRRQNIETFRIYSNRNGYEKFARDENRRVREERYPIRESRSLDIYGTKISDIRAARLSESLPTRFDYIRTARSLTYQDTRSDETHSKISDIMRSGSVDNSVSRSNDNRSIRSTTIRYTRAYETRNTRSLENRWRIERRAVRMNENRPTASDNIIITRLLDNRAIRSLPINIQATRSNEDWTARSNEVHLTRFNEKRSARSMDNVASRFDGNRYGRSATRYATTDSNRGTRYLKNRIAEFNGNLVERSVDNRDIGSSEKRLTRSENFRITRSLIDRTVESNEISFRTNRIRVLRSDDTAYIRRDRSRASLGNSDDRSLRSSDNLEKRLSINRLTFSDKSTATRSIKTDGIPARRSEDIRVARSNMNRLTRIVDNANIRFDNNRAIRSLDYRVNELDDIRNSRSVDNRRSSDNRSVRSNYVRTIRNDEIRSTRSEDKDSWSDGRSIDSRLIRSVEKPLVREERKNYKNGAALNEMIASERKTLFSGDSERNLLNSKIRTVRNKGSGDSSSRRSPLILSNSKKKPLGVERDLLSLKEKFINYNSESSPSILRVIPNEGTHRLRLNMERNIQELRNTRGIEQVNRRVSRNYRQDRRVEVTERRISSRTLLDEEESRKCSHEMRLVRFGIREESRQIEIKTESVDRKRFVGETRRNSLFDRSEASHIERIREFGNDKRQRQNLRMRSETNTENNGKSRNTREGTVMTNLRRVFTQRFLSITSSGLRLYGDIRRQHEYSRDIMLDNLKTSKQRMVQGESKLKAAVPMLNNMEHLRVIEYRFNPRKVERNSINVRVLMRRSTKDDKSTNSRRLHVGESSISRSTTTNTKYGNVRNRNNVKENHEIDEARKSKRISVTVERRVPIQSKLKDHRDANREILIRNQESENLYYRVMTGTETLLNMRKKTEYFNIGRSGKVHDKFRKIELERYISLREGIFGISSNFALQLTLATILIGQLLFSKLGSCKESNFPTNWMSKIKSF